jgi:hypothetical protein
MLNLVEWLLAVPGHRLVPLFDTDAALLVQTRLSGPEQRRLLKRSPEMEEAVISLVEAGLLDEQWQGLLYVMGWGAGKNFRPLYVGKAERWGVRNAMSVNLANIRSNTHLFARWGDGLAYHIGDLSHALFRFRAYRAPTRKYARWAATLFATTEPPRLKEPVSLYLAPWRDGTVGPSGLAGSLAAGEKEVIALASVQFADSLLNVDGV